MSIRLTLACKNPCLKGDLSPFPPGTRAQRDHQRMSTWLPGRSHMMMHWSLFYPPPLPLSPPPPHHLPACSAGSADRAAWRNPLSRHFSFPLTDGPWRARAFGPPAWLAARQLNKLSSCYNSLKHFQLPQSNKCCRRGASLQDPAAQRVLPFCMSAARCKNAAKTRANTVLLLHRRKRERGGNKTDFWLPPPPNLSAPSPSPLPPPRVCVTKIPNRSC